MYLASEHDCTYFEMCHGGELCSRYVVRRICRILTNLGTFCMEVAIFCVRIGINVYEALRFFESTKIVSVILNHAHWKMVKLSLVLLLTRALPDLIPCHILCHIPEQRLVFSISSPLIQLVSRIKISPLDFGEAQGLASSLRPINQSGKSMAESARSDRCLVGLR